MSSDDVRLTVSPNRLALPVASELAGYDRELIAGIWWKCDLIMSYHSIGVKRQQWEVPDGEEAGRIVPQSEGGLDANRSAWERSEPDRIVHAGI